MVKAKCSSLMNDQFDQNHFHGPRLWINSISETESLLKNVKEENEGERERGRRMIKIIP